MWLQPPPPLNHQKFILHNFFIALYITIECMQAVTSFKLHGAGAGHALNCFKFELIANIGLITYLTICEIEILDNDLIHPLLRSVYLIHECF